jgi:hypothetical protein
LTLCPFLSAFTYQQVKQSSSKGALVALFAWVAAGLMLVSARAEESIGLAIVYDTSGSMGLTVPDSVGKRTPKYVIANRAFLSIVGRLETFHKQHPAMVLRTSLTVFDKMNARTVVPFGDFQPEQFRAWLGGFAKPEGSTPLGEALRVAGQPLLKSGLSRRHILVVTDGESNGPLAPTSAIVGLRQALTPPDGSLGFHFIAFDVAASTFAPLKKLGATVLSASNEQQLGTQLAVILEKQILLEDEEPRSKTN